MCRGYSLVSEDCAFEKLAVGEIKHGDDLLGRDGGIKLHKGINRFAAFEKLDKTLDGDPGTAEARGAAHALRIHPDCFVQSTFLIGGHLRGGTV